MTTARAKTSLFGRTRVIPTGNDRDFEIFVYFFLIFRVRATAMNNSERTSVGRSLAVSVVYITHSPWLWLWGAKDSMTGMWVRLELRFLFYFHDRLSVSFLFVFVDVVLSVATIL